VGAAFRNPPSSSARGRKTRRTGTGSATEFFVGCYPVLTPNIRSTTKLFSMGIIGYIVSLLIVGFVVGGLGRLIVPGPNPIGAGRTLGVGLIGAFVGGLLGGLLGIGVLAIVFEVAISAGLVYLVSGRSRRLTSGGQHPR